MPNRQFPNFPKVYVVLVNWNGWQDTIECLESIYRSDYKNYQIIIVDNGSDDGSLNYIKAWVKNELCVWTPTSNPLRKYSTPPVFIPIFYVSYPIDGAKQIGDSNIERSLVKNAPLEGMHLLIFIEGKDNLGFGKGNNVALRYILTKNDHDYVWFLNNDTVIEPTSLSLMVAEAYNSRAIVGSVIKYYYSPTEVQAYGGGNLSMTTGIVKTENRKKPRRLNHINGASMMVDRCVLNRIGLFDEKIFMYFEETEYCMRAIKQNISFAVSDAIVYHKVGTLNRKGSGYFSWVNVYQNKFYSFMKHHGLGFWLICFWGMLIINMCNVKLHIDKRKASLDALLHSLTICRRKFIK